MRNCNDYDCLIGLAVDGLLDGPDKEALDRHLAECAACRRKLADMTAIRDALQQPVAVPEGLHDKIMAGVNAHEQKRKLRRLLKTVGSAAAALVLCFTAIRFMGIGSMKMEDAAMYGAANSVAMMDAAPMAPGAGMKAESADGGPAEVPQDYKSASGAPDADSVQDGSTGGIGGTGGTGGAATAPQEPSTTPPVLASPAPVPDNAAGSYRLLGSETGDGLIAFTLAWAFHLEVEGDPDKIRDILEGETANESAEGYTLLEVSGDMELVIKALKDAGLSYREDVRNGWAMEGQAPQNGIVSIKNK